MYWMHMPMKYWTIQEISESILCCGRKSGFLCVETVWFQVYTFEENCWSRVVYSLL